jgi:hypothetical protein
MINVLKMNATSSIDKNKFSIIILLKVFPLVFPSSLFPQKLFFNASSMTFLRFLHFKLMKVDQVVRKVSRIIAVELLKIFKKDSKKKEKSFWFFILQ